MRVLCVSDTVDERIYTAESRSRLAGVAFVLAAGDLPGTYLEFLVDALEVPLYYVFGNHEEEVILTEGQVPRLPMGCTNLDGRVVLHRVRAEQRVAPRILAGLGGSRRYRAGPHQYSEAEMLVRAVRLVPRLLWNRARWGHYLDVLLTHAPPWGVQDGPDLPHKGFRTFRWLMARFRPHYLIHGHYDAYDRRVAAQVRCGETWVVNAYGYYLLEVDDGD